MAGKHCKSSRPRSSVVRRGVPGGLAAAAVSATSLSTAFITGTAPAVSPAVELMALITPANSTAQIFAGTTYYGTDWETIYGPQQVVPFLLGPQGIANAIKANDDRIESPSSSDPNERILVLSSGWGAGQTGTALGSLTAEDVNHVDFVVLDNNTNRAGGGFWTTYYPFAPLLLTSAEPTPDQNLPVRVLDTAYRYNVNSNAVTYPANVVSDANSLVAYFYGYGGEQTAKLPDPTTDPLLPGYHYVVDPTTGKIIDSENLNDQPGENVTTTYVTFESGTWNGNTFVPDGPPLLRPLQLLPGGDILADTLGPAVTEIVDAGYKDNQPIPKDPTVPRPMGLLPTSETATMLNRLPGAIQKGLQDGADTAQEDFANPGNFVTKPLSELGKLPVISSLPTSLTNSTVNTTGGKRVLPGLNKPTGTTSSSGGARPLKRVADRIGSAVDNVTSHLGLQKNKPADAPED